MTLLALWGYAGSGKDEVARFLAKHHGFERVAFADPLKEIAYALNPVIGATNAPGGAEHLAALVDEFGWDNAKQVPEVRRLLQNLGVAARRHLYWDVWVDAAMRRVEDRTRCVISDCRFVNEAMAVKNAGGLVVRVQRPGVQAVNDHVSESELENWPFDATIHNDGYLDELGKRVEDAMERLGIL